MYMYCPDEEKWGQSPCWHGDWDGEPLLPHTRNSSGRLATGVIKLLFIHTHTLTGAHRAFPDVMAMEAVMTHSSLIPIRSAQKQIELTKDEVPLI